MLAFILLQRISELIIAKRNEKWMKNKGAYEVGKEHYKWMVLMHICFFFSLLAEVRASDYEQHPLFTIIISLFLTVQVGRLWAILSLGKYWNTKIIVLPNGNVVLKGPYKFMKHPNYTIVAAEFILIPLLFNAYWTLVVFSLLNLVILAVRIPKEEAALRSVTDYDVAMKYKRRFFPRKKAPKAN
ncbi:isoprenylcysteine carboxyl methyltransferase [Priestia megaterium]|nr:isoprenylcysteine carboxyl methyltransferase [Priestia megaterium]